MLRELTDINQEISVSDFSSLIYESNDNVNSEFNNTDWKNFILVLQVGENSINIFINEKVFDKIRHSFIVYTEVFNSTLVLRLVLRTAINSISRIFKIYDKIFDGKEVGTVYIDEKNSSLLINLRKC